MIIQASGDCPSCGGFAAVVNGRLMCQCGLDVAYRASRTVNPVAEVDEDASIPMQETRETVASVENTIPMPPIQTAPVARIEPSQVAPQRELTKVSQPFAAPVEESETAIPPLRRKRESQFQRTTRRNWFELLRREYQIATVIVGLGILVCGFILVGGPEIIAGILEDINPKKVNDGISDYAKDVAGYEGDDEERHLDPVQPNLQPNPRRDLADEGNQHSQPAPAPFVPPSIDLVNTSPQVLSTGHQKAVDQIWKDLLDQKVTTAYKSWLYLHNQLCPSHTNHAEGLAPICMLVPNCTRRFWERVYYALEEDIKTPFQMSFGSDGALLHAITPEVISIGRYGHYDRKTEHMIDGAALRLIPNLPTPVAFALARERKGSPALGDLVTGAYLLSIDMGGKAKVLLQKCLLVTDINGSSPNARSAKAAILMLTLCNTIDAQQTSEALALQ